MRQGWRAGLWWRQRKGVERVLQDRLHAPIATRLGEDVSFGSGFHTLRRVLLRQRDDAQTGTVAHFRVGLFVEDSFEQLRRVWTDAACPVPHARGRPLQMGLMASGTVLAIRHGLTPPATAQVGRDHWLMSKRSAGKGARAGFSRL